MYKHILVPTDGSELSRATISGAISLARALGARVTGCHVIPGGPVTRLEAWGRGSPDSASRLEALFTQNARRYLAGILDRAQAAGVRCKCLHVAGAQVYEEIIRTAIARRCDLIYMASHGRKGTADVILGSETVKVLTHSPIPVLVQRSRTTARRAPRRARSRQKS
jgi:nucleotide-binding universal stress UspA family protein